MVLTVGTEIETRSRNKKAMKQKTGVSTAYMVVGSDGNGPTCVAYLCLNGHSGPWSNQSPRGQGGVYYCNSTQMAKSGK
jgi:hypothetical protein